MIHLKPQELAYWQKYLTTLLPSEQPIQASVTAAYAGTPEITDDLLALYFVGKKTAGSSLVEDYLPAGDPLPEVGNYWIYLDGKFEPRCILRTDKIVIHKFKDVPSEVAIAEGEGDLSLGYWRQVHADLYTPHLQKWGLNTIDDATVITEFFSLVYR